MIEQPLDLHEDEHNLRLISRVHPPEWTNPQTKSIYNIVVIGGGTAGLVTAAIASRLGARVALIESHLLGGDCLNFGCVPSKTLIKSARSSYENATSFRFGINVGVSNAVDFRAVMSRVRQVRARISSNDSADRFSKLGVDVFLGHAEFTGRHKVVAGGAELRFKKAVIATGTRPAYPSVPGLLETGYLNNETVFELESLPRRLAVIGAGPIGCELSQAFQRLGAQVVLFHKNDHVLDREDPDAAAIVQDQFLKEGIDLKLNTRLLGISSTKNLEGKVIEFEQNNSNHEVVVDEILVATGRAPNVSNMGLEAAGVEYDSIGGITVNDYLQTTNLDIYAAGDVCTAYKFTHVADASARIVVENALFRKSGKLSDLVVPWCIYTDPEVAHVGLHERDASKKGIKTQSLKIENTEIDRAVTDGTLPGFASVLLRHRSDKILGATIVGPNAGELINQMTLAIKSNIGLKTISKTIFPYPTHSMIIKRLADSFMSYRLTPRLKWLTGNWFWLRRIL